jgi:hypothetical protein
MRYEAPKLVAMDEVASTQENCDCTYGYCALAGTCGFGCDALLKLSGYWPNPTASPTGGSLLK